MWMFCRPLFVLLYFFFLAIVFSVLLRYTDSDYLFGIFKLFLLIPFMFRFLGLMSHLRYLCLFVYCGFQHISCCFSFVFLHLVYPMLPVSLDYPFVIAPAVLSDYVVELSKHNMSLRQLFHRVKINVR
jgi:hypothetical protein